MSGAVGPQSSDASSGTPTDSSSGTPTGTDAQRASPVPASRARRLAAALVGVGVALVLLEIVFRITGVGEPPVTKYLLIDEVDTTREYHCYPSNPAGAFRPVPDVTQGTWTLERLTSPRTERIPAPEIAATLAEAPWCVEYVREHQGIRGPKPAMAPARGVARIAGMGDSFAFGDGVPYEDTLFVRLQKELGSGFEILNGGESGLNTAAEISKLRWMTAAFACHRSIVVFTLNDVPLDRELVQRLDVAYDLINLRGGQLGEGGKRAWLRRTSRVAEFVAGTLEIREIANTTIRTYLDAYDPAYNPAGLAGLQEQLRTLASMRSTPSALVIYPMLVDLGDYPLRSCHDTVARMAREAGLPVLDLLPAFEGESAASLHAHDIDHHPNGKANQIAARAIATWMRTDPAFRGR